MLTWHANKAKAEAKAEWIIWGERLAGPGIDVSLSGSATVSDDRRIITIVRRQEFAKGVPGQEDFARRIVECVNACSAIADPVETIKATRQLLLEMVKGEADSRDDRVLAMLARMVPAEELRDLHDADEAGG